MTTMDFEVPAHVLLAIQQRQFSSCFSELQGLAEKGSVEAKIALTYAYFHGKGGIRRDYKNARYWLEKIAPEDDATGYAAYQLGLIYCKGLGVSADDRLAFRHFRSAALRGSRKGLLMAAVLQNRGDGTLKKPRSANTIFSSCARDRNLNVFMRLLSFWLSIPKKPSANNGVRFTS